MLEADKIRPEIRCYLETVREIRLWSEKSFLDCLEQLPLKEDSASLWNLCSLLSPHAGWNSGAVSWIWGLSQIHPPWSPWSLEASASRTSSAGCSWVSLGVTVQGGAHLCLEISESLPFLLIPQMWRSMHRPRWLINQFNLSIPRAVLWKLDHPGEVVQLCLHWTALACPQGTA